jgi:GTP-binding protein LepA
VCLWFDWELRKNSYTNRIRAKFVSSAWVKPVLAGGLPCKNFGRVVYSTSFNSPQLHQHSIITEGTHLSSTIRNFCIIAHIDHGKSTLADRLLEHTKTITQREMMNQVLDDMDLERERGITIKSHAIQMAYTSKAGQKYTLNLIDTPGHVDFAYEVMRSLAACEGALLIVDAAQGVEAQTISNLYLAIDAGLEIIPVINKIDLPSADIPKVKAQIKELIGSREDEIVLASAKAGIGIDDILEAVVARIPAPKTETQKPLRALVFDSVFDAFRGAIAFVRVFEGELKQGDKIRFITTDIVHQAEEIGVLGLKRQPTTSIKAGNVGYLITGIKNVKDLRVGDTLTTIENPATESLIGYKEPKPMVFSGLYPVNSEDFEQLRDSLDKLALNDSSLVYTPESSVALGFGFRCGFLGLLHMEIIQERLEREYNMSIITTVPNVEYRVITTKGETVLVDNPSKMPNPTLIDHIQEPFISSQIITASDYIGNIMKLAIDRRGEYKDTKYIDPTRADLSFEFPLSEIIFDFYDKLKSVSRGYASFDYDYSGYRESDLVKLDVLLNGEPVDALSMIVHRAKSQEWGKKLCLKLKELIPKQMFEVAIQAAIGSKIISRETISARRKDVTAKCYGGDISRKRKLLEKQKEGKKRMKQVGRIEVPQEAFLAVLSIGDE